jgi:hypothetical protein
LSGSAFWLFALTWFIVPRRLAAWKWLVVENMDGSPMLLITNYREQL